MLIPPFDELHEIDYKPVKECPELQRRMSNTEYVERKTLDITEFGDPTNINFYK